MSSQASLRGIKCQVCKNDLSKYTCPACQVKTCSLKCVKEHKKIEECDGLVKTRYVPMNKITDQIFTKDFELLESIDRCVNSCVNDKTKRFSKYEETPIHLNRLKTAVYQRGSKILFLPQNFQRHQENTTYFDWKERILHWRVDLVFLNANLFKYSEARFDENLPLKELIKSCIDNESQEIKDALLPYSQAGIESLDVLMKVEKRKNSTKLFYKLDLKTSLKENLNGKTIIEFPQLYIVIRNFYNSIGEDHFKELSGMKNLLCGKEQLMETSTDNESESSSEEAAEEIDSESEEEMDEDPSLLPKYEDVLKSDYKSNIFELY